VATGGPIRHVYRWDLDKTYLRTDFDSLRGLLRAALEKATDKVNVAGSAALLRELEAVGDASVTIVSGSPTQLRQVLEEKLRLDGVSWDELVLKPNLKNVARGRFRAIRDQVGYKLPALLQARARVPVDSTETCFGDDAEADAFIYSLYADVLSGAVDAARLTRILEGAVSYEEDADLILGLAAAAPRRDAVRRIFIHLDAHSPPARFSAYGRRVVPIFNYFQVAVLLLLDGRLPPPAVVRVAAEMTQGYGYSLASLANSFQDLVRRGFAREEDARALALAFEAQSALIDALRPAKEVLSLFLGRLTMVAGAPHAPGGGAEIDYEALLAREGPPRKWRHKRKGKGKKRGPLEE